MTREDLFMLLGMTVIPAALAASLTFAAIAIGRMARRGSRTRYPTAGVALAVVMVAGMAGTFWLWGVGFDHADDLREPPAHLDTAMLLSLSTAAVAYVGFLATGMLAHRAFRRGATAS